MSAAESTVAIAEIPTRRPEMDRPVLVGVDWSEGSQHALQWAALVAGRTRHPLTLVHANSPWVGLEMAVPPFDYRNYAGAVASAMREWSTSVQGAPGIETEIVEDEPSRALLATQVRLDAGLTVLGAHAHGSWLPRLLGSVTSKVLHASPIPTAVVPLSADTDSVSDAIVVGVDGSASSLRALRWGAKWARSLGVGVYALCVFPFEAFAEKPRLADLSSADPAGDTLAALRSLSGQVSREEGIGIDSDVIVGHPAERLIESARDLFALVLGKTGHNSFARVVFGATSRTCATHATVPVVVIP